LKSSTTEGGGLAKLFTNKSLTGTTALLVYLGIADFIVHMFFAGNYGYFRDELYYIVSGTQHLSLGYVDFPPLVAYVAALLYPLSKDSLVSIHVVPALLDATTVVVVGMIARELGGGRRAQLLAALCTLVTLTFLADGSEFSPDAFDQLWWALLAYVVVRIVHRKESKNWILAGLVVGIGLLSKLTIFFFVGALLISFLAIPSARKYLRSKWIIIGGLLSLVFIFPMIYWNFVNGWPMVQFYLEFTGDVGGGGPINFFASQFGQINPLNIPIAIAGLYFFLRSSEGREFRALGLSFLLLYGFMTIIDMKPYYLAPAYSMLFAGGALMIEKSWTPKKGVWRWLRSRPYIICLLVVTILLSPIVMPILPPATLIKTYGTSTLSSANNSVASGESGPLPQNLGDRFGWNTMVSTLAQAYSPLPANEKTQACIFTSNYGEASAVNFLGKSQGLPVAISGHNSYFIWGPGSCTGQVLITVGEPLSSLNSTFKNVTLLTTITCQYCMDLENNLPVYLCLNPNFTSIAAEWQLVKQYD
jgi:4-amino-4-deoxy-L-arabinose transferase-like glycosyltransferase